MRKIWLTRHGESEYNERALLGGDSNISPAGQIYARLLPDVIVNRIPLVRSRVPPSHCFTCMLSTCMPAMQMCLPFFTPAQDVTQIQAWCMVKGYRECLCHCEHAAPQEACACAFKCSVQISV